MDVKVPRQQLTSRHGWKTLPVLHAPDLMTFFSVCFGEGDVMFCLALGGWIVGCGPRKIVFGSVEFQWRTMNTRRQSGELHLTVGVGSGLEVEPMGSGKAVGNVHLDRGRINRLPIRAHHGQFARTPDEHTTHFQSHLYIVYRFLLRTRLAPIDRDGRG